LFEQLKKKIGWTGGKSGKKKKKREREREEEEEEEEREREKERKKETCKVCKMHIY